MRTSTALFLVIFLCVVSSEHRREKFAAFFERLGDRVESAVERAGQRTSRCVQRVEQVEDSVTRELRDRLREASRRETAASNATRTLERGIAALADKNRRLRADVGRDRDAAPIVADTLDQLARQEAELKQELTGLAATRARLQGEITRLQSEIDLAQVRAERADAERFLTPSPVSALDGLAANGR